jgi:hypothetical protein
MHVFDIWVVNVNRLVDNKAIGLQIHHPMGTEGRTGICKTLPTGLRNTKNPQGSLPSLHDV